MHLSGFLWKLTAALEVNVLSLAASFWTLRSAPSRRSTDSSDLQLQVQALLVAGHRYVQSFEDQDLELAADAD